MASEVSETQIHVAQSRPRRFDLNAVLRKKGRKINERGEQMSASETY